MTELSPRQLFKIYGVKCPAVFSVIEIDQKGIGLEIFRVGNRETASPERAVKFFIPALLGGCPLAGHCPRS
jgi:hypothetical protein